ncbi:hypothetical protein [Sneathiella limimaris]|uniref:hypothetical protein n=1 Tax=Sneathiella limimaris TaxID=1964213 RepID=UPI001469FA81|nr:hypothetical protein [Sneathiella limimaris]
MSNSLGLLGVGLILGGLAGFLVAAGNGITLDGHDHSDPASHGGHGAHGSADHGGAAHAALHSSFVDLPADAGAPSVEFAVYKDPVAGWNVFLQTQNFTFAPRHASLEHVAGEGHAHIYVNGEKRARIYGDWFHMDSMPAGENTVQVTLNANDHRSYRVDGKPVQSELIVHVD